ncbi:MAG: histone deacetylase [Acidimicrobiales bacterium]
MTELVWYVAYGSNLSRARLQEYLDRGPDPSPPRDDRPLTIGHPLFFAGTSKVWTGGRAYVDHVAADPSTTLARAWLLTRPQWDDLHAQESGPDHGAGTDAKSLAEGEARIVGAGRYDVLLGLGRHEDVPVVTFTGLDRLDPATCARPAPAYLEQIATGLNEAHGLTVADAITYLLDRPGVADCWTGEELAAALRP